MVGEPMMSFVKIWRIGKPKIELKELVMLLTLHCIHQLKFFFFRVIGIQQSSMIFKRERKSIWLERLSNHFGSIKQVWLCLISFFSYSASHCIALQPWFRPGDYLQSKKLKKLNKEDDIKNRYLFLCSFSAPPEVGKSGDAYLVIHLGGITLT